MDREQMRAELRAIAALIRNDPCKNKEGASIRADLLNMFIFALQKSKTREDHEELMSHLLDFENKMDLKPKPRFEFLN